MRATRKATAALTLLALGRIGAAASPAAADNHVITADKAAAYQAEGLGTSTDRLSPSADVVPTVPSTARVGGIEIVSHTDAGLASLVGQGGPAVAAAGVTPAANGAPAAPAPQQAPARQQARRRIRRIRRATREPRRGCCASPRLRCARAGSRPPRIGWRAPRRRC